MPIGLVCIKCHSVFGALISDVEVKSSPFEAVCAQCVLDTNIVPDTPEKWREVIAQVKK
jgi:hypothetical protein